MTIWAYLALYVLPGAIIAAFLAYNFWRDRRERRRILAGFDPADVREIRDRLARVEAAQRPSNVIPFPQRRA